MAFSGNYHSESDILARFENDEAVAILTGNQDSLTVDSAVITEIGEGAEGELNTYIAVRNKVPVAVSANAELASLMKSRACDVSQYRLYQRGNVVPGTVLSSYADAIEWCKAIARGEADLPTDDTEDVTDTRNPRPTYGSPDPASTTRRFTRATQERL